MKRIYLLVAAALLVAALIGFILPWLFSAKSTIAVGIAVFLSISVVLAFVHVVYHNLNKENTKDENV